MNSNEVSIDSAGANVWNINTTWNAVESGPRQGLILRVSMSSKSDTSRFISENNEFIRINDREVYLYIPQWKGVHSKNTPITTPESFGKFTIKFERFRSTGVVDLWLSCDIINKATSRKLYEKRIISLKNSINYLVGDAIRKFRLRDVFLLFKKISEIRYKKNFINRYSLSLNDNILPSLRKNMDVLNQYGFYKDACGMKAGVYSLDLNLLHFEQKNKDVIFFMVPSRGAVEGDFSWSNEYGYYKYIGEKTGFNQGEFTLTKDTDVLFGIYYKNKIIKKHCPTIEINKIEGSLLNSAWYPKFVEKNIAYKNKSILVYADLNMNAVDGSSIWAASFCKAVSDINNVHAYFLLKENIDRDLLVSEFVTHPNVTLIQPKDIGLTSLDNSSLSSVVERIDSAIGFDLVVSRGREASETLSKVRRLHQRIAIYLTDIYEVDENGFSIPVKYIDSLNSMKKNAKAFFVQTKEIENLILSSVDDVTCYSLPPMLPFDLPKKKVRKDGAVKVVYAGKFAPMWGILELFEVIEHLNREGVEIELHLIGDKIHKDPNNSQFHIKVKEYLETPKSHVTWHGALSRSEALEISSNMDFAWAYRSSVLENNTLELSTKLLEYISIGIPTIVFRNAINENVLGYDYKYFVTGDRLLQEIEDILLTREDLDKDLIDGVKDKYSMRAASQTVERIITSSKDNTSKRIVIASHDFKFISEYESHLIQDGHTVVRDYWDWGGAIDESHSRMLLSWGDIFICEWSLANAAWYSNNIADNKKLFVRLHAQEVRSRAQKFSKGLNLDKVDEVIFVAGHILNRAKSLWHWPDTKLNVVPNYVFKPNKQYIESRSQKLSRSVKLGLLGAVPMLKRFDRAIDLIKLLSAKHPEINFSLSIKGRLPKDMPGMYANGGRKEEKEFFDRVFEQIEASDYLKAVVSFEPWTPSVSEWYEEVDVILSPSDDESFHYALADGVMHGCLPAIWEREGADLAFPSSWIGCGTDGVADIIELYLSMINLHETRNNFSEMISKKYDSKVVFENLDQRFLR